MSNQEDKPSVKITIQILNLLSRRGNTAWEYHRRVKRTFYHIPHGDKAVSNRHVGKSGRKTVRRGF